MAQKGQNGYNAHMKLGQIEDLPRLPATDVKKRGWRGVIRAVGKQGAVLVTNHGEPEAVVVSAAEYAALTDLAKQIESRTESELESLRTRFDDRLAALDGRDAGDRLRAVIRDPAGLGGKVKAGTDH